MKEVWYALRYGKWSCGWERWEGKPRFSLSRHYYDGTFVVFHAGPAWIELFY